MSLFSIVIPSHDRPALLGRLLRSIERQSFRDFEVLVVDDASSRPQDYAQVIEQYAPLFPLRCFRNGWNRGAQYSRNRGIAESTGALLAFVDDDDEWLPNKLAMQAALLLSAPGKVALAYSWANAVDAHGAVVHEYRSTKRGAALASLLDACFIPSPTVVVRRTALDVVGPFDEVLPSCQDWDMWTRVSAAGFELSLVEEVLALHHKHDGPTIGTSPQRLQGFRLFYAKHAHEYRQLGMSRVLSERYRGLAGQAATAGDRQFAGAALRDSIRAWPANWRAWTRYAQLLAGVWPQ